MCSGSTGVSCRRMPAEQRGIKRCKEILILLGYMADARRLRTACVACVAHFVRGPALRKGGSRISDTASHLALTLTISGGFSSAYTSIRHMGSAIERRYCKGVYRIVE